MSPCRRGSVRVHETERGNGHWRWRATAGGLYARRMQVYVENRSENLSAGEAYCNGEGPFSVGYCESDRFNWMFNSGVD
jgi:hypothetical protein